MVKLDSSVLVIFGITGDLANRKLLPALYNLVEKQKVPRRFKIIGVGRKAKSTAQLHEDVRKSLAKYGRRVQPKQEEHFLKLLQYHQMEFDRHQGYDTLAASLKKFGKGKVPNAIFHLATPPKFFGHIAHELQEHGLVNKECWTRVVFEKPFGHDLQSARALNKRIAEVFPEEHVYRIDHYVGKESVQNLLVLRFANTFFEPLWNHHYIDHIQITVNEEIGVGARGPGYYEKTGALRDMIQSHLLQLLMFVAMEPPGKLNAEMIHYEKVKALRAIEKINIKENVVRGQYTKGKVHGEPVPGYREEGGVPKGSTTETFVAMKLRIGNWRWQGVPIYLRTGKRMGKQLGRIVLQFKSDFDILFGKRLDPNLLTINFQPDEHVGFHFNTKRPGEQLITDPVVMDFCESCKYEESTPSAYEELLHAVMKGDRTLFTHWDEVEHEWRVVEPILEAWKQKFPMHPYPAGSDGPKAAHELLQRDGRQWL